jgi:hypothetical protein
MNAGVVPDVIPGYSSAVNLVIASIPIIFPA